MKNLLLVILLSVAPPLFAAEAPAEVELAFQNILSATIDDNYEKFIADTDTTIRTTLKAKDLTAVSIKIRPRAETGYSVSYFGSYRAGGHTVHLWKIMFQDGGDDVLASMSRKDDRISGFYLR